MIVFTLVECWQNSFTPPPSADLKVLSKLCSLAVGLLSRVKISSCWLLSSLSLADWRLSRSLRSSVFCCWGLHNSVLAFCSSLTDSFGLESSGPGKRWLSLTDSVSHSHRPSVAWAVLQGVFFSCPDQIYKSSCLTVGQSVGLRF